MKHIDKLQILTFEKTQIKLIVFCYTKRFKEYRAMLDNNGILITDVTKNEFNRIFNRYNIQSTLENLL